MGCYGYCEMPGRSFLTKDEKIEMLQEYKERLDKESKGVAERIKELEKEK
mgnify:CR=1 FL=1